MIRRRKNIMLKLKNIKNENGILSAEYDPEGSNLLGYIAIDIRTAEVIDSRESEYEKGFPNYKMHARMALKSMISEKPIPKERLVMWY